MPLALQTVLTYQSVSLEIFDITDFTDVSYTYTPCAEQVRQSAHTIQHEYNNTHIKHITLNVMLCRLYHIYIRNYVCTYVYTYIRTVCI